MLRPEIAARAVFNVTAVRYVYEKVVIESACSINALFTHYVLRYKPSARNQCVVNAVVLRF
jgi:hypothetical protein